MPGGSTNFAGGDFSFAAGNRARALHQGAFVWGDSTSDFFDSTAANQFLVRAAGGVGVNTNAPAGELQLGSAGDTTAFRLHSFVESPDVKNIYDGVVTTDAEGFATVALPRWFEALNRDFRYQLTVIDDGDDWVMPRSFARSPGGASPCGRAGGT